MTLWVLYSNRYNLLKPEQRGSRGSRTTVFLFADPALGAAIVNTLLLVGWVLVVTVGLGTMLSVLFDQPFFGRGAARILIISPFFVMPRSAR